MASSNSIDWESWGGGTVLLLVAIGILAAFYFLISSNLLIEIRLPVLAIAGVVALLIALALVAGAFALFNLSNPREALGLPEGSVRAVIALSLLVLFAILSIYLYEQMSHPRILQIPGVSPTERDQFLRTVPGSLVVTTVSNGQTGDAQRFTIYYRDSNPQSDEFAKQLLAMVGTLVTSVASFYFASKAAATPPSTGSTVGAPNIKGISPNAVTRGATVELQIAGDSLELIKEAKIVHDTAQVLATDLTSNGSLVKCKALIPTTDPTGAWDVIVTDTKGQQGKLPGALSVT